jgi:uncharacterized protein (DUF4415 family)
MNAKDWSIQLSSPELKSDMAKVIVTQLTDDDYLDAPEFIAQDLQRAIYREGGVVMPSPLRGRPTLAVKKTSLHLRLNPHIIESFKQTGKGWQSRMENALQEWLLKNKLPV